MIRFTEQLSYTLQEQLQSIALDSSDELQKATRSFYAVTGALSRLKEFITGYTFASAEEEIYFFKELKPSIHKQLIYWKEVIELETGKPSGGKKRLRDYYLQTLYAIDMFFLRNQRLRTYYRMGHTDHDGLYFLRSANNAGTATEYDPDLDPGFSTVMSARLAEILASQDLVVYIEDALGIFSDKVEKEGPGKPGKPVVFTGTKAQFIEFVYSLQSMGVLNNGQADVREAMDWFQYFLGIQVSNYYGYFQSMRIRKKDRTPFLNALIEWLTRRMDDSDEFPKFS